MQFCFDFSQRRSALIRASWPFSSQRLSALACSSLPCPLVFLFARAAFFFQRRPFPFFFPPVLDALCLALSLDSHAAAAVCLMITPVQLNRHHVHFEIRRAGWRASRGAGLRLTETLLVRQNYRAALMNRIRELINT